MAPQAIDVSTVIPCTSIPSGDFAPTPRQARSLELISTALAHGWQLAETDPARAQTASDLRIIPLIRSPRQCALRGSGTLW